MKPTTANKTGRATKQDVVMTPYHTAKWIVEHFEPQGKMLEPCRGDGAFYKAMQEYNHALKGLSVEVEDVDWCEISEGKDFFDYNGKVDWIITNPPYSIFDDFLDKAFEVADNVVMFVPFSKLFKSKQLKDLFISEFSKPMLLTTSETIFLISDTSATSGVTRSNSHLTVGHTPRAHSKLLNPFSIS